MINSCPKNNSQILKLYADVNFLRLIRSLHYCVTTDMWNIQDVPLTEKSAILDMLIHVSYVKLQC